MRLLPVVLLVAVQVCSLSGAAAQPAGEQRLGNAETEVKKHIGQVLKELPGYQNYGKDVAERAVKDAKAGNIQGLEAPRQHPWAKTGNPLSSFDYYMDSFYNLDSTVANALNWAQAWSCFEPKLLAKAKDGKVWVSEAGPGNDDLVAECRLKCVSRKVHIPFDRPSIIGAILYDAAYGCVGDPDPWGYEEDGYEVVEYWYPENQVSINNYGINRIRPEELSPTGAKFTRSALIAQKTGIPESQIKQLVGESYPMDLASAKLLQNRADPLIGQGVWGGYAAPDYEDKSYAHVVRTWLSVEAGKRAKKTRMGWEVDPEFSLYDALPPSPLVKDPVNMWTEYGMWDVLSSVPHFSHRIRPEIMQGLVGAAGPYSEKARQENPFWQSIGSTAFRIARWPQYFKPLEENFKIKPNLNNALRESVYKGGYDLFPLVLNQSGFGAPALATGAIFARKALYIAGARSPAAFGGDASGELQRIFPQGEKGRIATYTVNVLNKGQEIDKMQLIAPKRPKAGTRFGGLPPIVSECFRSQNIPNLVNMDQNLERWVQGSLPGVIESSPQLQNAVSGSGIADSIKGNMPRTLNGYVTDVDTASLQGGDITITYWNRRIGCFCDRCGIPFGSTPSILFGDGDVLYDRPRKELCRYPLYPRMTPWSAWHKSDTFEACMKNGSTQPYDGTGLRDEG